MSALPIDFPEAGLKALEIIQKASAWVCETLVDITHRLWGDIGAIDWAISNVWLPDHNRINESMGRLNSALSVLASDKAQGAWEGNARQAYIAWYRNFEEKVLTQLRLNVGDVKDHLDKVVRQLWFIRARWVAMVVEIAASVSAASVGVEPLSLAASFAFGCQALEFYFNARPDFDKLGRDLETLQNRGNIGGGQPGLALPFDTQVIGDWDNWEHRNPKRA